MTTASSPPKAFLCFGVGAIGAYIGGSLALAGHRVVFVERPEMADEIRRLGLALQVGETVRRVAGPEVVSSVEAALALGPFEAAILAVKSFDTAAVLESVRPYAAGMPPVVSFQNGVENEPLLAAVLGSEKVIAGTVTTAIGRRGPGAVAVERLRGIGVATNHPLGPALVAVMSRAGLRAMAFPNPAAMKWSKLLTNLIANASSAILDLTPAQVFAHPGLYKMEVRQLREALRVMRAQNIPVVDLPATPVQALAWVVSRLPLPASRLLLQRSVGKGRGEKMPSFHIDLYSGRGKSEGDFLNGAVARYGKHFHVAAPVNKTLNTILMDLTRGAIPREAYAHQPEKLLAEIPDE
jgi:2-dehydropantoate 2-reductase